MKRDDFEAVVLSMASLIVDDLKQAEIEEAKKGRISNLRVRALWKHVFATSGQVMGSDHSRASYRGQIWGGSLWL